jgi:putative transposase
VDDAAVAPKVLAQLAQQPCGKVRRVFADSKYHNFALYHWVKENGGYCLEIVRRPEDSEGWITLPKRWMVERTFARLIKCRRLNLDREKTTLSSEAMIRLAMIHLMLHRLRPENAQQEYHYRKAG